MTSAIAIKKRFTKVNIEISNICNLQCSFCPEVIRPKKRMTEDLFTRVIQEVAPFTNEVAFHLMGDPLTHPDLDRFLEVTHAHGLRVFLVTNGVLLREKQAQALLHPALKQVSFSLHSFHDNFGADRDPTPYLERIFTYTENAFRARPDLYINYRLWNLQTTEVTGATYSSEASKRDANEQMLARIFERFGLSLTEFHARKTDIRIRKGYPIQNRLSLHFDTEFTWPSLDLPLIGTQGTCKGLSTHIGILADGTVVPCCLDKEAAIPLGRIPEQPLTAILDSARAQRILDGFRRGQLQEDLCQRCQYIERFQKKGPSIRSNSIQT
jgi:MoaA/NifB/PqqE/SkfB family radical SAM enzyme